MRKNDEVLNKDGQPTRRKFRVYCAHEGCNEFIIGKWGGGYACVKTKLGMFDWRNQEWLCKKHKEFTLIRIKNQEAIK